MGKSGSAGVLVHHHYLEGETACGTVERTRIDQALLRLDHDDEWTWRRASSGDKKAAAEDEDRRAERNSVYVCAKREEVVDMIGKKRLGLLVDNDPSTCIEPKIVHHFTSTYMICMSR